MGAGDNRPPNFKGGAVWSVMQTLHNGMVGIGYALVVLFFAISLCKNTMNFHELKRPEAAIHYFLRFVAAKALVGYGMDIMLNVFSICNGIVTDMANSMGGISEAMVSLPAEMQTAIENVGFLASIPLWLVTILGSLFITVLSFVMILTVYGRFSACICTQRWLRCRWRLLRGKHTIRGHIIFEKLCRRVLRGCGHCTGLRDLLSICQYANSSQRRGDHYCVELSCGNSFQYARIGWPYQRL